MIDHSKSAIHLSSAKETITMSMQTKAAALTRRQAAAARRATRRHAVRSDRHGARAALRDIVRTR